MIDLLSIICGSFLAGWILGRSLNLRLRWWTQRDPFARWWRRSPYSCSAIWMAATQEDADKFRSRFIDPSIGEPWPEPMTVDDWARDRRRGSNPPPPDRNPQPPSGPPQPLAADLIRYFRWNDEQIKRALRDEPIRLDEGTVQRGNGSGGPTTPKPDIVPKPQSPSPREIPGDMP